MKVGRFCIVKAKGFYFVKAKRNLNYESGEILHFEGKEDFIL